MLTSNFLVGHALVPLADICMEQFVGLGGFIPLKVCAFFAPKAIVNNTDLVAIVQNNVYAATKVNVNDLSGEIRPLAHLREVIFLG